MVEPVAPFERGVFDGLEAAPPSSPVDDLRFVQAVHRLGQSVAVTDIADRELCRVDPGFGEALGRLDGHILPPTIATMNETASLGRPAVIKRLFLGTTPRDASRDLPSEEPTNQRRPANLLLTKSI